MKKYIAAALIVFCVAFVGTVIRGYLFNNSATSSGSAPKTTSGISATEVAKHNSVSDCWLIINDKVYSLASYLEAHPGGVRAIALYCGKDGTLAFDTKDRRRPQPHSAYAESLLGDYYLGDLAK